MNRSQLPINALVRWWFAAALLVALVSAALLATPSGEAFVGQAQVAAEYMYYVYLTMVFKS